MKNKKNGFTLVELLAVIAVLGLILIIAVPKITGTLENSKKKTLELTAKSIARSAEEKKIENDTFDIEEEITCDSISDYSNEDFSSCTIKFDEDGNASVTLIGKGSYKGLYVCNGTKMNATAQKKGCSSTSLLLHIKTLYNDEITRNSNGLTKDNTVDQNIRYSGSNNVVKNYVEFGNTNELWRIIGIFEVETAEGKTEELVKIVREDSIGDIAWDNSDETINDGDGINQWGASGDYLGADLMQLLNGKYLSKQDAESACATFNGDKYEFGTCNFSSTGMSSTYKNMIETVVWNTGAWDRMDTSIADFGNSNLNIVNLYNAERGTVGKTCSATDSEGNANNYCNDTVERTTTWEGLVALPYPTDYGYASSETGCNTNMQTGLDYEPYSTACKNNNWMHYGTSSENSREVTWFLSPVAHPDFAHFVSSIDGGGMADYYDADSPLRVRPTLYLRSNVKIEDGDGSEGNAYKLTLNSGQ